MRWLLRALWARLRGTQLVLWASLYVLGAAIAGAGQLLKDAAKDRFSEAWNGGDEDDDEDEDDEGDWRHRRR